MDLGLPLPSAPAQLGSAVWAWWYETKARNPFSVWGLHSVLRNHLRPSDMQSLKQKQAEQLIQCLPFFSMNTSSLSSIQASKMYYQSQMTHYSQAKSHRGDFWGSNAARGLHLAPDPEVCHHWSKTSRAALSWGKADQVHKLFCHDKFPVVLSLNFTCQYRTLSFKKIVCALCSHGLGSMSYWFQWGHTLR